MKRIILALTLIFALIPMSGYAQEAPDTTQKTKKLLAVINAYSEVAPWPRNFINSVVQEVSNYPDFEPVRVEHLCNILIHNQEEYDRMSENLFESFGDDVPDYLVLIGNFTITLRDQIKAHWGDVPMLLVTMTTNYGPTEFYFTGLPSDTELPTLRPLEELRDDFNFSIIYTPTRYRETIDMMLEIFPQMRKLVFLGDSMYLNRLYTRLIKDYVELKYPNIEYEWLTAANEGDILPYLNNDDPSIGLLLSTWNYEDKSVLGYPTVSSTDSYMIKNAHRPVFGLRLAYMTFGTFGGYFDDGDEVEQLMLGGLHDLLSDKEMRSVPFRGPATPKPYINYLQLDKLHLSPSICPPGTEFFYHTESNWERYKYYVWIVIAVLILIILILVIARLSNRGPRFRHTMDGLVDSMPIGYMQVMISLDKKGKVKHVEYGEQNMMLKEFVAEHNLKQMYSDHQLEYWQEAADHVRHKDTPQTVIAKSPTDDTYIEFIVKADPLSTDTKLLVDEFAIDVTDKMKMEQVLREAADNAIEADNMKSAFLANMSHEIRTPLNAIVGFANLLCKTTDPEKKKRFIEIIETNNQLLLKLIGDILDISKADSDKLVMNMHKVDVNKLITTVCAGIDMSSRPNVRLEKKFALDQCYITSDSYRITQVLNNLITNAVKFTERGSITVGYEVHGGMLKFYVKDTGIGITESDMKKLFTRFTKLNSFVQGTGLGLSISKAIVEKLGGSIKGESAGKSKGATFYFTLPMVINEAAEQETQPQQDDERRLEELKLKANAERRRKQLEAASYDEKATKPSYKMEKKKILVVEDNPSNAELFDALLADRYEIVHATDGKEAVQVYVKETPDLVLMDLNLPIKDGYEATAEIRTLSNAVPIIAVTAYAQNSDRVKVLNSGFDDYLSKPVDENMLIDTIRKFLG